MSVRFPVTNPNPADGETSVNIYGYVPSLALAGATVAIFGFYVIAHAAFAVIFGRPRAARTTATTATGGKKGTAASTRVFEILICIGCIFEIVGYSFRIASHFNPYKLYHFIVNYFMIVVVSLAL